MKQWDFIAEKLRQHPDSSEVSCDGVVPSGDFCPWPLNNAEKVNAIMEDVYLEMNLDNHAQKRIFLRTGDDAYNCKRAGVDIFRCEDEHGDAFFFPHSLTMRPKHKNQAKKERLTKGRQPVAAGLPSREIRSERLEVCAGCPMLDQKSQACGECGCPVERLAARPGPGQAICPLRKWSK